MKISKRKLLVLLAFSTLLNTTAVIKLTFPRLINKFQQYTSQRQHTLQTANDTTLYINGQSLAVYGKYHNENNWYRFPSSLKEKLRPEVWQLSKNSSGIYIDFSTNSPYLKAKWQLKNGLQPRNMTAIGASGLDLYVKENDQFKYVCSGIPDQLQNEQTLISGMDSSVKDFRIYLPLYNEVENFSIGIDPKAFHNTPKEHTSEQPIVFYGTSITQGGSASRPGMAYPSIISRILNKEVINLGFSGNGLFEKSVGDAIIEIDASIYVIDCTPNAHPITIQENALNLIKQLRATNKQTPILLIESIYRTPSYLKQEPDSVFGTHAFITNQNKELRKVFTEAVALGFSDIYYLNSKELIGNDREGTVDGTHFSDLGHYRMAQSVSEKIKQITTLK